jgi:L-serine/L-threonine ammonia-lyase
MQCVDAAAAAYVSPFNHPDIWDGHATMIDEVKQQLQDVKPAAVVVSVGGGGLFLGTERCGFSKAAGEYRCC